MSPKYTTGNQPGTRKGRLASEKIDILTIPRMYFWKDLDWATSHISEKCVVAFLENPVGFGGLKGVAKPQTMRSAGVRNTVTRRGLCSPCYVDFTKQRTQRRRPTDSRADRRRLKRLIG